MLSVSLEAFFFFFFFDVGRSGSRSKVVGALAETMGLSALLSVANSRGPGWVPDLSMPTISASADWTSPATARNFDISLLIEAIEASSAASFSSSSSI